MYVHVSCVDFQVLMRALRDFNTPKIITDDVTIFMGLIGDLFPALDVPRKRDLDFEEFVKKSMVVGCCFSSLQHSHTSFPSSVFQEQGLQPEELFVLKVVQLEELLHVRHSVFVIGNAGTGTYMYM